LASLWLVIVPVVATIGHSTPAVRHHVLARIDPQQVGLFGVSRSPAFGWPCWPAFGW